MTNAELQALTQQISNRDFGKPFQHQVVFNSRLKTTGGRYHLKDHHIDINPRMLTDFDEDTLVGVIRHELVHYHLSLAGRPFDHRSQEFKQLLKTVHGSRYAPAAQQPARKSRTVYVYVCERCERRYPRKRHINVERYRCGACGGRLYLQESVTEQA